jgi:hypothetical protein
METKRSKRFFGLIFISFITLIWSLLSAPSFAQSPPSFSIGAYGGILIPTSDRALDGYSDEWTDGNAFGISALYRFKIGLALELFAEQMTIGIEDSNGEWGEIEVTPVFLLVKYQGFPASQKGFAFHAGAGLGFASSDVKIKRASISGADFSTDTAILFEGDVGMDYFFTKNFSLALDGRLIIGDIDSAVTFNGSPRPDVTFNTNNIQILLGAKVWF